MKKVNVNGRVGVTTSVIPHSDGKYPVWFDDSEGVEFIDSVNVKFI